ncbi:MAG: sugar phosphate nucleotidyltransferase [Alphaproteobacteria bacterium]
MKVLILAGGRGRRFGAMTDSIPKPLVPIAGTPMIRRVMDIYAEQGFREFVIALGYRVDDVCDYFNETASTGDMVVEVAARPAAVSDLTPRELAAAPLPNGEKVHLVHTGDHSCKTRRIAQLRPYVAGDTFMLTYCDGIADIDLNALIAFHRSHGRIMTMTAVHGRERFGILDLDGERVASLREKPRELDRWINGGFLVVEPKIFEYMDDPDQGFETGVIQRLIKDGELAAYQHHGFWEGVDSSYDRDVVEAYYRERAEREPEHAAGL